MERLRAAFVFVPSVCYWTCVLWGYREGLAWTLHMAFIVWRNRNWPTPRSPR